MSFMKTDIMEFSAVTSDHPGGPGRGCPKQAGRNPKDEEKLDKTVVTQEREAVRKYEGDLWTWASAKGKEESEEALKFPTYLTKDNFSELFSCVSKQDYIIHRATQLKADEQKGKYGSERDYKAQEAAKRKAEDETAKEDEKKHRLP